MKKLTGDKRLLALGEAWAERTGYTIFIIWKYNRVTNIPSNSVMHVVG